MTGAYFLHYKTSLLLLLAGQESTTFQLRLVKDFRTYCGPARRRKVEKLWGTVCRNKKVTSRPSTNPTNPIFGKYFFMFHDHFVTLWLHYFWPICYLFLQTALHRKLQTNLVNRTLLYILFVNCQLNLIDHCQTHNHISISHYWIKCIIF